jgi:hypothetical protein
MEYEVRISLIQRLNADMTPSLADVVFAAPEVSAT